MHDPLVRLYLPSYDPPSELPSDHFLTLPPVAEDVPPPSEIVISLICSYFVHGISVFCSALRLPSRPPGSLAMEVFVSAMHEDSSQLFSYWLPYLSPDSARTKTIDSACIKLYTVCSKTCSSLLSSPPTPRRQANSSTKSSQAPAASDIFRLRTFSLLCLAHTSPGTIESEAFWSEVGKVVAEFDEPDTDARQYHVLRSLNDLVLAVERRSDSSGYLDPEGKRFRSVVDGWLTMARVVSSPS